MKELLEESLERIAKELEGGSREAALLMKLSFVFVEWNVQDLADLESSLEDAQKYRTLCK